MLRHEGVTWGEQGTGTTQHRLPFHNTNANTNANTNTNPFKSQKILFMARTLGSHLIQTEGD